MTLKYRELKRRYELDGGEQTVSHLSEALRDGHLKPEDFSIRDLAEALVPDGREWVRMLDPRSAGSVSVLEADDGVDVTAFLNITGQVIYSKIMEAYNAGGVRLSRSWSTRFPTRLDGEKIPGIGRDRRHDRRGRARHAVSASGLRRGLHRDAVDHEARLHRAGDQGGDLLRSHAPGAEPGGGGRRGARPQQGEAARSTS